MTIDSRPHFQEGAHRQRPIRELGLCIQGTRLEPLIETFRAELLAVGLAKISPAFYLSTEWGVAMGSVAIAIPFYLADPDLAAYHKERIGHVEGVSDSEILQYLRHEMGHVVNYAYALYEREDWVSTFGPIARPYSEDYRVKPFSRDFVRHLPGWYAQKHPDEDWAETFAVWMTPGNDWRHDYQYWPGALQKLEFMSALMEQVSDRDPLSVAEAWDEPVDDLTYSLDDHYEAVKVKHNVFEELDGLLRSVFPEPQSPDNGRDAGELIRDLEDVVMEQIFVWTGHFPEHTRALLREMARHADSLQLTYSTVEEPKAIVSLTTFVTALAMNYVSSGSYR